MTIATLTALNSYADDPQVFYPDTVVIDRTVGNTFRHQPVTWNLVRTFGPLTGTGVQLTYSIDTANVTISFPDSAFATHTLAINTVGNVTTVGNILDVLDYNAARAQFTPAGSVTGNVTYTVAHINTNDLSGNINVGYVARPV